MSGKTKIRVQAQLIAELRDKLRASGRPRVAGCRIHPTANHYDFAGLLRCTECELELIRKDRRQQANAETTLLGDKGKSE